MFRLLMPTLGLIVAIVSGAGSARAQAGAPVSNIVIRSDTVLGDIEELLE